MATDLQEAIKAIRAMAPIIDPEEDYLTIVEAEEQIEIAEANRKKELEEAHAKLKAITRTLEAARVSSTRPRTVQSVEAHATALNELDALRLSLAKNISDAEGYLASKEAELSALKEEACSLEQSDPAVDHEKDLDSSVLRLEIYKGMGFQPILDSQGNATKMIVRAQSGDIHSVEFNNSKTEYEYVDLLWRLASS